MSGTVGRMGTPIERFEKKVSPEPNSGCWLWLNTQERYGLFHFCPGNIDGAHRAAWRLFRGPIPDGLFVLHRCDVPRCVNPDHLFLGTQLENRRDCQRKNRVARGASIGNAMLTEDIVATIKCRHRSGERPIDIARSLNLKRVTISAVVTGRNWAHIV